MRHQKRNAVAVKRALIFTIEYGDIDLLTDKSSPKCI